MKILITGAAGLLGHGLMQVIRKNHDVFPLTRVDADITDAGAVRAAFRYFCPELVIHAAAIPDLDLCEEDPERAFLVNQEGTRHVVEAAREVKSSVAYISTDAVFDGLKNTPYTETDAANPPTVYGRSKLLGEQIVKDLPEHWIFRIPVLFGPGKTNFVDRGLRSLADGKAFIAASDQIGGALYTLDAAQTIMELVVKKSYGLFHLTNSGPCSRLDIALRAAKLAGLNSSRVIGKKGAEMGRCAVRLKYAVMDMRALRQAGIASPRPWEEALAEYISSRS